MRLFLAAIGVVLALSCQAEAQQYYADYAYYMIERDPALMEDATSVGGGRAEAHCFAKALATDTYGAADYQLLSDVAALRGRLTQQDKVRILASEQAMKARLGADKMAATSYLDGLWKRCSPLRK